MSKNNSNKRIIVFGASGVLGREVVRIFKEHKYTVRGYTHDSPIESDRIRSIICTDTYGEDIKDRIINGKAALVVNCAAYNDVEEAETKLGRYKAYSVNTLGPTNIALACYIAGIPLVHISTDYVFNNFGGNVGVGGFDEHMYTDPQTVYGKSKVLGEKNVMEICQTSWIFRTSGVFGRHLEGFPSRLISHIGKGEDLCLAMDSAYCPTYAPELARVILEAFRKKILFGLYHAAGEEISPFMFAQEILKVQIPIMDDNKPMGKINAVVFSAANAGRAPRPQFSILNCNKLKQAGIVPPRGWTALTGEENEKT
jgi:dTDP-4-dehydrorhamnose reductase